MDRQPHKHTVRQMERKPKLEKYRILQATMDI